MTQIKCIKDKIKLFTSERHLYDNSYKISNIGKYTREFQDFSSIRYSQYANYTLNELCELADLISSFDIFIKEYSSILKSDHCLTISKTFETYKYSTYSKKNKFLFIDFLMTRITFETDLKTLSENEPIDFIKYVVQN
jgi:hypothetical protein